MVSYLLFKRLSDLLEATRDDLSLIKTLAESHHLNYRNAVTLLIKVNFMPAKLVLARTVASTLRNSPPS